MTSLLGDISPAATAASGVGNSIAEIIETTFFRAFPLEEEELVRIWKEGEEILKRRDVLDFFLVPGRIQIKIRNSAGEPGLVQWNLEEILKERWSLAIENLSGSALPLALVLAGSLPPEVAEKWFIPQIEEFGALRCALCDATPCAHRAALVKKLLRTVESDPFSLLQVRGKGREELLAELWTRRRQHSRMPTESAGTAPKNIQWEKYYSTPPELFTIPYSLKADELPGSLFTRLDTPPLERLSEDAEQWFHQAYLEVARRAQAFGITLQKQASE